MNAVNPVMGVTGLLEDFIGGDSEEKRANVIAGIPLGRLSLPEDIANATLYLASDEADMVTGVAVEVDGGRCILCLGDSVGDDAPTEGRAACRVDDPGAPNDTVPTTIRAPAIELEKPHRKD